MDAERFIVVSGYFPPVIGGTSTVMRNLLSAFAPESFMVIAEKPDSFDGAHDAAALPGVRVVRCGVPHFIKRISYGVKLTRWLRFCLIPRLVMRICGAAREISAGRIVAVFPSWPFMIAAHLAHRRLGIPLITYHMDLCADASRLAWPDRPIVEHFEKPILRGAAQRLALSEAIARDFRERFGLESVVVPHSIDPSARPEGPPWPAGGKRLIVHTGVVELLQREGLLRLAGVIQAHPELNAKLVLATPTSREDLLACGFDLPCIEILKLSDGEVRALQRAAAVLVAVLPFHCEIDVYQLTSFPTKAVEYMTTGVPILAHAPANSFFAGHVRAHGYALLADSPEPQALYEALAQLLENGTIRDGVVARARATANEVFALPRVARHFAEACGLDPAAVLKPQAGRGGA